jgi:hypothetical protein
MKKKAGAKGKRAVRGLATRKAGRVKGGEMQSSTSKKLSDTQGTIVRNIGG